MNTPTSPSRAKRASLWIIAAIILVLSFALNAPAIEPWADQKLPVQDGLELWLSAAQENSARAALSIPPISQNGFLDRWHDGSGKKHDVRQAGESLRPTLLLFPTPTARFDGRGNFLTAAGLGSELTEATIFVRATPRANSGFFRALLSFNKSGANDYTSGFNLDFGGIATMELNAINVEGNGTVGAQDLLNLSVPFGAPHTFSVVSRLGDKGVQLWLDGLVQGARARATGKLSLDELAIGARTYSHTANPPYAQGFFEGDIAEVLIYNRALNDAERAQVEKYLATKYAMHEFGGRKPVAIDTTTNIPPIQMFVPGFTVRQLPVQLNNINDIKYRADGKLVALAYDGRVWLLSDTDGDGLEDKATVFWDKSPLLAPIGMALTPPGYAKGEGVFAVGKGKLVLLLDTNHDDIADSEIIVAKDWQPMDLKGHGVDGLGVAVAKDGAVYFGIGAANYTDGYRVYTNGKSSYDLKSDRGTIERVSPDFSKREIVCTGIRFPVALAFNAAGDLFSSDQEGATWLPNGNPFDELLHIQPGRHYGFPPRHPKHLPNVIDEPSVFDYAPQHQSTCGLNFNEPVTPNGPTFGPAFWKGDALMTGYSRGKLWRTKLVKTPAGYVAQNQLFASLEMLTVDSCVSPQGDLVVSMHTGPPDWGTGPNGKGKLFKIAYTDKTVPQPVLTWAAGPSETCIEFDQPLDATKLKELAKSIVVTEGRYVAAGDRFEVLRPGYQVVQNQLATARAELEVISTGLSPDGRTLSIRTIPRDRALGFAVTMPRINPTPDTSKGGLPQHNAIDLAHDLSGVEASWRSADGKQSWEGWLPHIDLSVSRAFTTGSGTHDRLWQRMGQAGTLTLQTQLDLWQMLRAATQPGAKLDFEYPPETVTLVFKASGKLDLTAASAKVERVSDNESRVTLSSERDKWLALRAALVSTSGEPKLEVSWFTAEDSRPRALPLRRILMPWAMPFETGPAVETERVVPEIAGGNWVNGRKIFFGEQAVCYKCHTVGARGGKIGPDLSNLIHRDYASVMKDITQPSAAINPDHVAYNVQLKNEDVISGLPTGEEGQNVLIADSSGKLTPIPRNQIVSMKPSNVSLMPEGLLSSLKPQQLKDLLTFLLMPPPLAPAPLEAPSEPPPRNRAEIEQLLTASSKNADQPLRPLNIVLCAGPKDHGPGEHDYPLWQKRWTKLLGLAEQVTVQTAERWPSAEQLAKADVIVFYSNNPDWSAKRAPELDAFFSRGGGAVYLHYAVDGQKNGDELAERIGLAWRGGQSKFRHGPLDLKLQPHPITEGLQRAQFIDESYWQLIGSEKNITLLASGDEDGKPQPLIWAREQGKGRVFVSIPGHYTWTFDDPIFRLLILRGVAWSAREPLDRFNDLCLVGARVKD